MPTAKRCWCRCSSMYSLKYCNKHQGGSSEALQQTQSHSLHLCCSTEDHFQQQHNIKSLKTLLSAATPPSCHSRQADSTSLLPHSTPALLETFPGLSAPLGHQGQVLPEGQSGSEINILSGESNAPPHCAGQGHHILPCSSHNLKEEWKEVQDQAYLAQVRASCTSRW